MNYNIFHLTIHTFFALYWALIVYKHKRNLFFHFIGINRVSHSMFCQTMTEWFDNFGWHKKIDIKDTNQRQISVKSLILFVCIQAGNARKNYPLCILSNFVNQSNLLNATSEMCCNSHIVMLWNGKTFTRQFFPFSVGNRIWFSNIVKKY